MKTGLSYNFFSLRKFYTASDVTPMRKKILHLFYWLLKHVGKRITRIENKTNLGGLINNARYKESATALNMGDFLQ